MAATQKLVSRRQFLRQTFFPALAVGVPTLVPAAVWGRPGHVAPGSRITLAGIGVGPQGRGVLNGFLRLPEVRVVAVCDVARRNLNLACDQVNRHYHNADCRTYRDFRELLARPDLDAVLIATPDHWHVSIALAAARAGKDIYLEKPMGLSVAEDQMLRRMCQAKKRIFQFGTQQRSAREFRRACELVRNGRIGKLLQINVWAPASRPGGATTPAPVPEDLDYEFWLGPAPATPYTPGKCFDNDPPGTWKTWWYNADYALGFIAGWGVHPLDIALWGYPEMMRGPIEVTGQCILPSAGACNTAVAWEVNFRFASGVGLRFRGTKNGFEETHPMNDFRDWQARYGAIHDHGTAFEGTDGWVHVRRGALSTHPEHLAEEPLGAAEKPLPVSSNHPQNFIESVRSRRPAICPIEDAVQADILCHLSDIASRLGRRLRWDPRKEKFIGDSEANKRLALRPMRAPWRL